MENEPNEMNPKDFEISDEYAKRIIDLLKIRNDGFTEPHPSRPVFSCNTHSIATLSPLSQN